jgi:TrmH RNA methyltransferase
VERVHGVAAALAVLERRPRDVLRIAYAPSAERALSGALRDAARRRVPVRRLDPEALTEMAGAAHHEGVCVLCRPKPVPELGELVARTRPRGLVLALDAVDNPHNVGAVLRSAAFFGASGLIVSDAARRTLPPAAVRIAEGGAEHVPVLHAPQLPPLLSALRAEGLSIVGADARGKVSLAELRWPERAVLVLGAERTGLSPRTRELCQVVTRIGGSGAVESLNVSVAAGVLLASWAHAGRGPAERA